MDTHSTRRAGRVVRRTVAALLLAAGLGACVYAPPYAYDPYYSGYSYPTYVGPPIALDFGFGYYKHHHSYRGHRGHYGGHRHGGYRHGWGYGRGRR